MKILDLTKKQGRKPVPVFEDELKKMGELTIMENVSEIPEEKWVRVVREHDVLLIQRNTPRIPHSIIADYGSLKLMCATVGSLKPYLSKDFFKAPFKVCNWGDAPAEIAEAALCLLMATLKDLHHQIAVIRDDGWAIDLNYHGGRMSGLKIGVYGCGFIGRRFIELLSPFDCHVKVFDPFVQNLPPQTTRAESLEDLFATSQAIVIHAALNDRTKHSVNAHLLSLLPRHGIIINTARGGIIDQEALFKELETGRLRAGLDVLEPDWLPPGHPAKKWDNCIFTAHQIHRGWPSDGGPRTELLRAEINCLNNIKKLQLGEELDFVITEEIFERMT